MLTRSFSGDTQGDVAAEMFKAFAAEAKHGDVNFQVHHGFDMATNEPLLLVRIAGKEYPVMKSFLDYLKTYDLPVPPVLKPFLEKIEEHMAAAELEAVGKGREAGRQ